MANPFDISVHANVQEISRSLSRLAHTQINFATAQALTALAKEVQADEIRNIATTFRKPKPFTQKSVGIQGVRKDTLQAKVFVRPIAAKYLEPYEKGGAHVLSGRALINPKNIKLDSYGQLPRKALARLKARKDVFIGKIKTSKGAVNGVWQRIPAKRKLPAHLKLLIRFGDSLPVKKRLNYQSRAQAIVDRRFNAVFAEAMSKALASAR